MRAASAGLLAMTVVLLAATALGCRGSSRSDAEAGARAVDAATDAAEAEAAIPAAAQAPDDLAPPVAGEELTGRARHLLEAIGRDDATLAADLLFPRDGWMTLRDASDPGKDWERHVSGLFRRSVHALSRRHLGLERAQFASLELGRTVSQATPKRRGWTKPLWTVRDSRLTFVVDGRTKMLPIREMTAWRGAWYVTRLR